MSEGRGACEGGGMSEGHGHEGQAGPNTHWGRVGRDVWWGNGGGGTTCAGGGRGEAWGGVGGHLCNQIRDFVRGMWEGHARGACGRAMGGGMWEGCGGRGMREGNVGGA